MVSHQRHSESSNDHPRLVRTADLIRTGVDPRAGVGSGRICRVRRGGYADVGDWEEASSRQRYLAFLEATSRGLAHEPLLTHVSAAAVWDLPILGFWPQLLTETVSGRMARSTRYTRRYRREAMPRAVRHEGWLVTPPARTVLDVAATEGFASGLMAADDALRRELCTPADLAAELERLDTPRGLRVARAVVEHADGRAEWPGESLSRARMIESGIPVPELQVDFYDDDGVFLGRADFYWREYDVIGEFDGRIKYGRALVGDEQMSGEVAWRERQREKSLGRVVTDLVRWTWSEALGTHPMVLKLRDAGIRPVRRARRRRDRAAPGHPGDAAAV